MFYVVPIRDYGKKIQLMEQWDGQKRTESCEIFLVVSFWINGNFCISNSTLSFNWQNIEMTNIAVLSSSLVSSITLGF